MGFIVAARPASTAGGVLWARVAALFAFPAGLALFQEGAGALEAVLRCAQERREIALEAEPILERQPEALHHGLLGIAQRHGRLAGKLTGQLHRRLHQIGGGADSLDEADPQRLGGTASRAGEDHLARLAASDQPRQPPRPAAAR